MPWSALKHHALPLTIFGFAGSVVWLQEIPLDTAARVGALGVGACLAAGPVHGAFIKVWERQEKTQGLDQKQSLLRCLKRE